MLTEDVVVSEAMARQETERYTFRAPGQATSYFCYQRLMALRAEVERVLGPRFDRLRYHDFLLSQGLLPPSLLGRPCSRASSPLRAKPEIVWRGANFDGAKITHHLVLLNSRIADGRWASR